MIKYKIVKDGENYHIYFKTFLCWTCIGNYTSFSGGMSTFLIANFSSEQEAEKQARKLFGSLAKRVRRRRII